MAARRMLEMFEWDADEEDLPAPSIISGPNLLKPMLG